MFRCSASLIVVMAGLCSAQDLGLGKVLVAKEDSPDSLFAKSVILLVSYDHDGTVGLMVNQRTKVPISRALQELKGAKGRSEPVFIGGPVEGQNVLALLRASTMPEGATHVSDKIYLVPNRQLLEKSLAAQSGPSEFRVYLGYCGWGPGQLENETRQGFWHVLSGNADLVFDSEPETLWSRLIARAGQRIAGARVPEQRVVIATVSTSHPGTNQGFVLRSKIGRPVSRGYIGRVPQHS